MTNLLKYLNPVTKFKLQIPVILMLLFPWHGPCPCCQEVVVFACSFWVFLSLVHSSTTFNHCSFISLFSYLLLHHIWSVPSKHVLFYVFISHTLQYSKYLFVFSVPTRKYIWQFQKLLFFNWFTIILISHLKIIRIQRFSLLMKKLKELVVYCPFFIINVSL